MVGRYLRRLLVALVVADKAVLDKAGKTTQLPELQTQAAAEVVVVHKTVLAKQAAPASSSSSTHWVLLRS